MLKKIKSMINSYMLKKEHNKEIKKYNKLKLVFDNLDNKFELGVITKPELDTYYKIKEELIEMTKRLIIKDGKIVLNTQPEQPQQAVKPQVVKPQVVQPQAVQPQAVQPVEQQPVEQQPVEQQPVEQQPVEQQAEQSQVVQNDGKQGIDKLEQMKQQAAQQQAAQQHAQQQHAQQQEMLFRRQYEQQVAQQHAQQQEMLRRQYEQQVAQQQHAQQQQQVEQQVAQQNSDDDEIVINVYIAVVDLPEFKVPVLYKDIEQFSKIINESMMTNKPFKVGNYVINGNKILMYRFEQEVE